jgi:hypothetical protein
MVAYSPTPVGPPLGASASFEVQHELAPEIRSLWKKWGNTESNIVKYLNAMRDVVQNDLATSGYVARVVPPDAPADFRITATGLEFKPDDFRLRFTFVATEVATGRQVSNRTREVSYGTGMLNAKINLALPGLITDLKRDVAADIQQALQARRDEATRKEAEAFAQATLAGLLAGQDKSVSLARARNRALIAAKTTQLPALLRDSRTADLTTLVVKIEQVILDLDHECEVAKDQAQRILAESSANSSRVDELRGLSICYRERIELLKPMLGALKDELVNRDR